MSVPTNPHAFNAQFIGLSPPAQHQRYLALAHTALAHYNLDARNLVFLQHNSGVTYRVASGHGDREYLLKIHEPIGTGMGTPPPLIRAQLHWLASLASTTTLAVQNPIPNRDGELLTVVRDTALPAPWVCSLQQWVAGAPAQGHFTPAQTEQVGALLAHLHAAGNQVPPTFAGPLPHFSVDDVPERIAELQPAVVAGWLTPDQWARLAEAGQHIQHRLASLVYNADTWGPIHGDVHHDNIVWHGDEVRLIDFDNLHVAPYYLDLGTTLYHIHYQGGTAHRALLAGYQRVRTLPDDYRQYVDAALTYVAIDNLAFQITIPAQHNSPIFQRNLHQLANEFCRALLTGQGIVQG